MPPGRSFAKVKRTVGLHAITSHKRHQIRTINDDQGAIGDSILELNTIQST